MTENITWVEAKLGDSAIAKLVAQLTSKNKSIETGGCGCGDEIRGSKARAKQG
jgi:hypothetical protein